MDGIIFVVFLNFVSLSETLDSNMCGAGKCCTGYILRNNTCIECEAGTTGVNCSKACTDGYYGSFCREACSTDCKGICNKVNGTCPVNIQAVYTVVTTSSTLQTGIRNNNTDNSIEKTIEHFLKDNLWIIAGVSSGLVILTCGCIAVFVFCKICKCVGRKRTLAGHPNQDTQPSYSVRYESDRGMQGCSADIGRPPRANENGSANGSANKNKPKTPNVEYSKPKAKKRYSLVRKFTVSQEVTSCPNVSEDEEDVFDSDDCEDYTNTHGAVQISELPSQQSFNTFLSPYGNTQSENNDNTEYGKLWR